MCNNAEDCEQYCSDNTCCTCRNREWYRLYNDYKAKEQECEELKIYIESNEQQVKEVETLVMDNDRLINELDRLNEDRIEALKQLEFVRTLNTVKEAETIKLHKTLTEIKEIAKPYQRDIDKICGYCRKYDSCHACCIDDLKFYEYRTSTTKACERFVELERFNINIVANKILQKISEVGNG